MIWWLLTLYPAIGLGLGIYYTPKYLEYKVAGGLSWLLPLMTFGWPIFWSTARADITANREAIETHEEWQTEELPESVRRERLAPDPRLAEFDILLGIEPERKKLVWEDYLSQGWDVIDDSRLCDAPEFLVRDISWY